MFKHLKRNVRNHGKAKNQKGSESQKVRKSKYDEKFLSVSCLRHQRRSSRTWLSVWQLHQDAELTFHSLKLDQELSLWKGSSKETPSPEEEWGEKAKRCWSSQRSVENGYNQSDNFYCGSYCILFRFFLNFNIAFIFRQEWEVNMVIITLLKQSWWWPWTFAQQRWNHRWADLVTGNVCLLEFICWIMSFLTKSGFKDISESIWINYGN